MGLQAGGGDPKRPLQEWRLESGRGETLERGRLKAEEED